MRTHWFRSWTLTKWAYLSSFVGWMVVNAMLISETSEPKKVNSHFSLTARIVAVDFAFPMWFSLRITFDDTFFSSHSDWIRILCFAFNFLMRNECVETLESSSLRVKLKLISQTNIEITLRLIHIKKWIQVKPFLILHNSENGVQHSVRLHIMIFHWCDIQHISMKEEKRIYFWKKSAEHKLFPVKISC